MPQVNPNQYPLIVNNARYNGKRPSELPNETIQYIERITKTKSTVIRLYKDNLFVFKGNKGHAHHLVTVFPLKERYMPECLSG